jgi:hypothetical protein
MGYEIKLHVGEISSVDQETFLEIACVDVSKIGTGPLNHLIQFAKGKSVPVEFKDFKFLKDIKGNHLDVDQASSDFFDLGMDYINVEIWEGESRLGEDLYGDPLPAIPLDHVLAAVNEELKYDDYRRFKIAQALLNEFTSSAWGRDIYVVPFGH